MGESRTAPQVEQRRSRWQYLHRRTTGGQKSPHKTMASHIHHRYESSKHQLGPAHVPGHYWDFILSSLTQPQLHPAGSRAALWCRSAERSRLLAAGRAGAARWGKKRRANASPAWLHHAASGMWREDFALFINAARVKNIFHNI